MIELEEPRERALLVGAPLKSVPPELTEEHLEELGRLADTAGADIVGSLTQRLDTPHPKFHVGEGKAEELRELALETEATLIVFDEELTPAQGKNLEQFTGVRVMDRAELILDIFATRARTAEARMQVELAQLQYLLPRLTRMWTHLSRVRGGIGMRGPGETQIETDRRMIDHRISRLKDDLLRVATQRATQRKGREQVMQAALVGYTNAGKSSVLRAISGTDVYVEDRLFATLDAATRQVDLGEGEVALLTDTVGFIRKLPHHLVASFRATLEEAQEADLLLHVIDLSHHGWEEQKEVVDEVLADLDLAERRDGARLQQGGSPHARRGGGVAPARRRQLPQRERLRFHGGARWRGAAAGSAAGAGAAIQAAGAHHPPGVGRCGCSRRSTGRARCWSVRTRGVRSA